MENLNEIELASRMTCSTATEPRRLSSTEAAYLAGLVDGDGALYIEKRRHRAHYRPFLIISNTHRAVVYMCNKYGGCWYVQKFTEKQDQYVWKFTVKLCKFYLPQILPYLVIKAKQGVILLEALKECRGTGHPQNEEKLEFYRKELQRLNRTVPKKGRLD